MANTMLQILMHITPFVSYIHFSKHVLFCLYTYVRNVRINLFSVTASF